MSLTMLDKVLRSSKKPSKDQSAEYFFSTYKPAVHWAPHEYQKECVDFLLANSFAALFLEPGLGKTATTLAALVELKKKGFINKILIIAPLRVCYLVWRQEIEKWSNFNHLSCVLLHGKDKDKRFEEEADIYLINHEGFTWLINPSKQVNKGKAHLKVSSDRLKRLGVDALVIDELSKFKSVSTDRYKILKPLLDTFRVRWGLTGSPASNGLIDLFGQCYMLDKGETLGKYISHYRAEYFTCDYTGRGWVLNQGAEQRIHKRLEPLALTMKTEDYLKMPALIENDIFVDLPPKASKAYKEIEKDLITNFQNNTLVASNAASASIKCRQVANGAIYRNKDLTLPDEVIQQGVCKEWISVHDEKVAALCDLIDELQGAPLLVAYDFNHDLERIKAKLGENTPYIGSGVTEARTMEIVNEWNRGNIPVLLGHPQSMAHGLNMQGAGQHIAFFSLPWSLELYEQFIRRVYRQGTTHKTVFVHHILARNTVDMVMLSTIKSKDKTQQALFNALKKALTV